MSKSVNLFFSELLQQFRKRKRLSQKQLAEHIGASREAVGLWERGYYKPETDTTLYELVRVLDLTEQEQRRLFEAYTVTALTVSFHNPPLARNPYFTGRSTQFTNLHTLLIARKQVALTQAISGLGGVGKTQLALEYAYHYQKSYHDIFWAFADTYESLMASYIRLAALLHLPEYDEPDQSKVKPAVQRWLSKHTGWLLILDNIEDLSLVDQFVPIDRQGAVLLTTRRQVTEPIAQALELGPLPENEAILFLLRRTKILSIDMSLDDASNRDIANARTITQVLGNLPLALDQAGAYILEAQCSFDDYLALFKSHQSELLQRRVGEGITSEHPESVTATFTLNFRQVQQRSNAAAELLRVCAFLASDGIGEEILVQGASHLGPILQSLGSNGLLLNQAIEILRTFSLIRRNPEEKTFSIHRLVQAVLQDTMAAETKKQWMQRVVVAVDAVFPNVEFSERMACERQLQHALLCATWIEQEQMTIPEASHLLNQIGLYLADHAQYAEAESLYQRALTIDTKAHGMGHSEGTTVLNNLADLYASQGKYAEAEPLYLRALIIIEQQLGTEHPNMGYCLSNLALLYQEQGKYTEAEPLYQRALIIDTKAYGTDHPRVATTLNNFALLYESQGRYAEAEPLYQRALTIVEQQLGAEHPDMSRSLNNLALLFASQGKYTEAEPLHQRALAIDTKAYGANHPTIAIDLNSLASLYMRQSRYAEAEPLYLRAIAINEQRLGDEHPNTVSCLNNLAKLYASQSKYTEAETLYLRAIAINEQRLGVEHPNIGRSLYNLAEMYRIQGKYAEAEPLHQRALTIMEQQLGTEHPHTQKVRGDYVSLLQAIGQDQ